MSGKSSFERWSEEARLRDLPDDEADDPAPEAPGIDRALVAEVRAYLADHLTQEADWRWTKAKQYPDDRRNHKAALGLANAADQVRRLPADDPRLVRLAELVAEAGGRVQAITFRDPTGRNFTAALYFWVSGGDLDGLLERIIAASERVAAETFRAAS